MKPKHEASLKKGQEQQCVDQDLNEVLNTSLHQSVDLEGILQVRSISWIWVCLPEA